MHVLIGIEQTVTGRHSTSWHMTDRSFGSSLLTRREIFPLDIVLCLTSCTGSIEHDRLRVCMSDGGRTGDERESERARKESLEVAPTTSAIFTARRSNACAVLGVVILSVRLSVRLSVCHTRAL